MSKAQRDKGKRGEQKAVHILRPAFPDAARDLNDVYAKEGVDLTHTGRLAVQVKHYATHAPISRIEEVKPSDGRLPVLMSIPTDRKSRPTVTMYAEEFVQILCDIGLAYEDK